MLRKFTELYQVAGILSPGIVLWMSYLGGVSWLCLLPVAIIIFKKLMIPT